VGIAEVETAKLLFFSELPALFRMKNSGNRLTRMSPNMGDHPLAPLNIDRLADDTLMTKRAVGRADYPVVLHRGSRVFAQ